jgi:GT2 family glycosyltransferase
LTSSPPFAVVVCTRNRPGLLAQTLDALGAQSRPDFPIVVVDQSDSADPALELRATSDRRVTVVPDGGRGLSRARNIGSRRTDSDWVVFVDDDCVPEPEWAERLAEALVAHPEAEIVSGHVEGTASDGDYVPVSAFPIARPSLRRGRFRHPGHIGFGVCMAVRRSAIERLGGWDERLGPGQAEFPAADDMDFNYRLLRSGGVAYLTPAVRARHEQWRSPADLETLYRGYLRAWAGFAMKHLRSGDPLGGLWLWTIGVVDFLDMLESALRRRSRRRLRLAAAKLRGLVEGTLRGLRARW